MVLRKPHGKHDGCLATDLSIIALQQLPIIDASQLQCTVKLPMTITSWNRWKTKKKYAHMCGLAFAADCEAGVVKADDLAPCSINIVVITVFMFLRKKTIFVFTTSMKKEKHWNPIELDLKMNPPWILSKPHFRSISDSVLAIITVNYFQARTS